MFCKARYLVIEGIAYLWSTSSRSYATVSKCPGYYVPEHQNYTQPFPLITVCYDRCLTVFPLPLVFPGTGTLFSVSFFQNPAS